MKLAQLQAAFHALATRGTAPPMGAEAFLVGTPELPASERIGIYADMYSWRLADALGQDYPAVAAILGDERFFALADAYAHEHPSDDPDLGQYGRRLVEFLQQHPARERPDLADVAALELARTEVFFEAPSVPAARAVLASLSAAEFAGVRLDPIPALRVLRLHHDVRDVWRAAAAHGPIGAPVAEGTALAVWRFGWDVFHARIDPDEANALERACNQETLGNVCAEFARRADPAGVAYAALVSWFDEGWIASIRPSEGAPSGGHDPATNLR